MNISEDTGLTEEQDYDDCLYQGTRSLHIKIYLIGIFANTIAIVSVVFNSFYSLVFIRNPSLRRGPLYYFGVLAVLDTIMALNYIALMVLPVYMDNFQVFWLYRVFHQYLKPMMMESAAAIFASMTLILVATVERFLRTFQSKTIVACRRRLERRRPYVCIFCICFALCYKACVYVELRIHENHNCTGFARLSIEAGDIMQLELYRFWWAFVVRNFIDRIIPFFLLVAMNFYIICALKREQHRQSIVIGGFSDERDDGNVFNAKTSLREATRSLIAVVSMYLMSQSLNVLINFWETIHRPSLEFEFTQFYDYANDASSILVLLASCLRFPVYCALNRPISRASIETLAWFFRIFPSARCRRRPKMEELPHKNRAGSDPLLAETNPSDDQLVQKFSRITTV